jgi:HAMP domain-containing protein
MKIASILKGGLLGLALLLATSAFAANKGSLQVSSPVSVAGKQLAAGDYTVKWEGAGPSVEVSIMQGKNTLAKVPAKVVALDNPSSYDSAVVNTNGDGSRFSGKKFALEISGESSGAMGGSSSN